MKSADETKWEAAGRELQRRPACLLWRRYCDQLNRHWLQRRLPDRTYAAVLKTDLFDEAAGEGVYARLQARAARFCGIDISASTCRLATARYARLAATVADVRCLPFADESFDLVLSFSTLDHFASASEIEKALRCLYRVLRPGGYLLVTLDNAQQSAGVDSELHSLADAGEDPPGTLPRRRHPACCRPPQGSGGCRV